MTESNGKAFDFLEHTADVYVAAYGKNLAEAFENAALAMFETMTDTEDVEPKIMKTVEVEGYDRQALLYNWLEELLILFEVNNILFSKFKVEKIEENAKGLKLKAHVYGEQFSPEKHRQKVAIKAITYHRMEIQEASKRVTVKYILDI